MIARSGFPLRNLARLALGIVALVVAGAAPVDDGAGTLLGLWSNPRDSVHIRIEPCGEGLCGVVAWASDKAKADAARGGTPRLIGQRLFQDFMPDRPGVWRGRVFVPDMGRTFSGTITLVDETRLEAEGCLAGRLGCRAQTWTRLSD